MVNKLGTAWIENPDTAKKTLLSPIEDRLHLRSFLSYRDGGKSVGATLLEKFNREESVRVVFGFKCRGVKPILTEAEVFNLHAGVKALNDMPRGENLTVHYGQFIDDGEARARLRQQMRSATPELRMLLGAQAKRLQELSSAGIRKVNFLDLYVTYTVDESIEQGNGDIFDRLLDRIDKLWYQVTGAYEEVKKCAIHEILLEAYQKGFCRWERLLSNQVGLTVEPMTLDEMRRGIWVRFNSGPARPVNHVLVDVNEGIFEERVISEIHPKSYIFHDAVPVAGRRSVEARGKVTGVLCFEDKPDVDGEQLDELFYLHDILSDDSVHDMEIITQLRRGSDRILKDKLSSLTKQARNATQQAEDRGEIDVGADLAVERAVEAQRALYQDQEPFYVGSVILVHRDSEFDLDRACSDLCSRFRRDGWLVREEEYAWRTYLQTFPQLCWESLMAVPYNRRRTYLTSELFRILPLVCNRSKESEGFEFIADEGQCPIYFPSHLPLRTLVTAASGSGKSMLLIDTIVRLLPVENHVSTVLDFPREDGTGSFTGICQYLPEYFSEVRVGDSDFGWNMLEPPAFKGFEPGERSKRFDMFKERVLSILVPLVMGFRPSPNLDIDTDTVRSILLKVINTFYRDVEIRERFADAFRGGFGSSRWQQIPTLTDLLPFVSLERLELPSLSGTLLKTLDFIKLKLISWLDSRLGRMLSRPTSFQDSSKALIVVLQGLTNETDAFIIGAVSYLGAIRRSLASEYSLLCIEECPTLFDFEPLALDAGMFCATGRKSGIGIVLIAQELGSLLKCAGADKIFGNLDIKITGRVNPTETDRFIDIFKYPPALIARNAGENYGLNRTEIYSRWLYDDGSLFPVRHYPPLELFALSANDRRETRLRDTFWREYPGDRVRGLHELTRRFGERVA